MNQYIKVILSIAGFAILLGGSYLLYQRFAGEYGQSNLVEMEIQQEEGGVADSTPAAGDAGGYEAETETPQVSMAADFTVVDVQGGEVSLTSLLGRPIVLNFWASWCPPCISEMPEFQKIYEEQGSEILFLMVNVTDGSRETTETAGAFIAEQGYTFPVYYDVYLSAANAYSVTSIPATYFINAEGEIAAGARGAIDEETLLMGISMIQE